MMLTLVCGTSMAAEAPSPRRVVVGRDPMLALALPEGWSIEATPRGRGQRFTISVAGRPDVRAELIVLLDGLRMGSHAHVLDVPDVPRQCRPRPALAGAGQGNVVFGERCDLELAEGVAASTFVSPLRWKIVEGRIVYPRSEAELADSFGQLFDSIRRVEPSATPAEVPLTVRLDQRTLSGGGGRARLELPDDCAIVAPTTPDDTESWFARCDGALVSVRFSAASGVDVAAVEKRVRREGGEVTCVDVSVDGTPVRRCDVRRSVFVKLAPRRRHRGLTLLVPDRNLTWRLDCMMEEPSTGILDDIGAGFRLGPTAAPSPTPGLP